MAFLGEKKERSRLFKVLKKNERIINPKLSITVSSSEGMGHVGGTPQGRAAPASKLFLWELEKDHSLGR